MTMNIKEAKEQIKNAMTAYLPTDWEDRVCCFQTLLHPLRSGVPSFPELLCPLSPSARFPVWVSVWVKGRREPAIAPPA